MLCGLRIAWIEGFRQVGVVGAHIHLRPSGNGGRAQQKAGDDVAWRMGLVVGGLLIGEVTLLADLQLPYDALGLVKLLVDGRSVSLVMGLVARTDFADGDGAVCKAVGP